MKYHEQQEGWTHEYMPDGQCVCFCRPQELGGGFVTVDFSARIFNTGYGRPKRPAIQKSYGGRGWKDAIIRDAIDHLEAIMTKEA
jgi:hypothetical protein